MVIYINNEFLMSQSINIIFFFPGYLCAPDANIYNIDFIRFKIRDLDTGMVLFEIAKPSVILGMINDCIDSIYYNMFDVLCVKLCAQMTIKLKEKWRRQI